MSRAPLRPIAEAEIVAYERDGVVALSAVFDDGWIGLLRDAVDVAMAEPGPHAEVYTADDKPGRFFGDLDVWTRHAPFRSFVHESPAAEIAATIMRSAKVNFFYDQLLVKEPGTAETPPWHQDQPYWAVAGRQVCSIWLPLDPVPAETSVAFVRGSHRWGRAFLPYHFMDQTPYQGRDLEPMPDIDASPEAYDIGRFALEPGDCLVFQAMIVHGAPGNASASHRRRALATRRTGDDATYCVHAGEVAIPTSDPGLSHGDAMDCDLFPRIWPRDD